MSALGQAYVEITGRIDGLDRTLKKAKDQTGQAMDRISKSIKAVPWTKITVGATAAGGALAYAMKQALDTADSIDKAAGKIGIATESLQTLRFAADQSGVAANTLDMALQRFSRRVGEAAQGGGELAKTLDQYGIAVRNADGGTRKLESILGDLAESIQGAGSQSEQLRIAFKAFDSEGAALVNMLKQGSEGMEELQEKAREAGLVMNDRLIDAAVQAKDQLALATDIIKTGFTKALIALAPTVSRIAENFNEWASSINNVIQGMLPMSLATIDELNRRIGETEDVIDSLMEKQRNPSGKLGYSGVYSQQLEVEREKLEELKAERDEAQATLESYNAALNRGTGAMGNHTTAMGQASDASEEMQANWMSEQKLFEKAVSNWSTFKPRGKNDNVFSTHRAKDSQVRGGFKRHARPSCRQVFCSPKHRLNSFFDRPLFDSQLPSVQCASA